MRQEARPVYLEFEVRAVEDREASMKEGHYVGKDTDWVVVTPPGGNLTVEKPAEEWLQDKVRVEDPYAEKYRQMYEAWKRGQEIPVEGTAIREWPVVSPSQVRMLQSVNILTVEDLATVTDSTLEKMGIGARALQNKALTWLEQANDSGKVAEQVAGLMTRLESLEQTLKDKDATIARLQARLEDEPPKRGRPKKAA